MLPAISIVSSVFLLSYSCIYSVVGKELDPKATLGQDGTPNGPSNQSQFKNPSYFQSNMQYYQPQYIPTQACPATPTSPAVADALEILAASCSTLLNSCNAAVTSYQQTILDLVVQVVACVQGPPPPPGTPAPGTPGTPGTPATPATPTPPGGLTELLTAILTSLNNLLTDLVNAVSDLLDNLLLNLNILLSGAVDQILNTILDALNVAVDRILTALQPILDALAELVNQVAALVAAIAAAIGKREITDESFNENLAIDGQ